MNGLSAWIKVSVDVASPQLAAKIRRNSENDSPGLSAIWMYDHVRCYRQLQCADSESRCYVCVPQRHLPKQISQRTVLRWAFSNTKKQGQIRNQRPQITQGRLQTRAKSPPSTRHASVPCVPINIRKNCARDFYYVKSTEINVDDDCNAEISWTT